MYDVTIVGGGVAGAYLASRLDGLNVLLIEKNKKVLLKDSGIVSRDFLDFFDRRLVRHEITRMDAFSPSGRTFALSSREPFAYIIKRMTFSKYLRAKAGRTATVVHENALGVTYSKDHVAIHTTGGAFRSKMVVGADGANSVVRRCAHIERPLLALGIMVKTGNELGGNINVFFNKYYSPDFFSWIIPQNNEYGTITAYGREYLKYFEKSQYLPGGDVFAYLIPTGYVKSHSHRTILVGDACGQNKPLTGGGIMFGLKAASYAAPVITEAVQKNRFDSGTLSKYEKSWKRDFAWEIDKQFLARMLYRRLTNKDIDKIFLELGPHIEKLSSFDYDKFSRAWIKMPKLKLARLALGLALDTLR